MNDRTFERMLFESQQLMMMYTLANRQVYVGFTLDLPNPASDGKWVRIVPMLSGTRDRAGTVTLRVACHRLLDRRFFEEFDENVLHGSWVANGPNLLQECIDARSFAPIVRGVGALVCRAPFRHPGGKKWPSTCSALSCASASNGERPEKRPKNAIGCPRPVLSVSV